MLDFNAEGRMLLGTVGWERQDWLHDYYPRDLPPEWRLAYYANDCNCVFLRAADWCATETGRLEELLDEVQGRLVFFLEVAPPGRLESCANLALFESQAATLLVKDVDLSYKALPQWRAMGEGVWVDDASAATLLLWSIRAVDFRELRARADAAGQRVRALVLDGPGADPGRMPELRAMLELMGKA